MKMSRACSGMLSSENDDFNFLKTVTIIICTCITCTIALGFCNWFITSDQLVVDQKPNSSQRAELHFLNIEISILVTFIDAENRIPTSRNKCYLELITTY